VGYVFGRRRQAKTHGQLMREELNEGFGHLWQAAAHAAGGVGATVGPKWDTARDHLPPSIGKARTLAASGLGTTIAAFTPLLVAARTGAETATTKARKARNKAVKKESGMSRKRTTVLVGLLTAGVAAGAAGAIMARRRSRAKWDEYEQRGIQAARQGARSVFDAAQSTVDKGAQRMESAATSTKETANLFADQTAQASGTAAARAGDAIEHGRSKTDQFAEKAATISKNSRN
jgi:gas vesicle protein